MHVFFKVLYSHDAFQAKGPTTHESNLAIKERLPHHQHLNISENVNIFISYI